MKSRFMIMAFLAFFMLAKTVMAEGVSPQVELFSPQGIVKKVRQVSVRFSTQMVAFGDLRLEDPFEVKCAEKGKGRWADGRNWEYNFDKDLLAGVECEFTLKPGIKDLAGNE